MTPRRSIPYVLIDPENPLPFDRIEAIIRQGEFLDWDPVQIRLGQIGDGGNHRPEVFEFTCEMDGGLLAVFRSDEYGIPQQFSKVPTETHAARHEAAFAVSHMMEVDLVPVSAARDHPTIGHGTLTAMIEGESFLYVDLKSRSTRGHKIPPRLPTALSEAYVFDHLIGSGQRAESSYVVSADGVVRSQYHHEAFSWTEVRRLMTAFAAGRQTVSKEFWEKLREFDRKEFKKQRLERVLQNLVKSSSTHRFFTAFDQILSSRRLGEEHIFIE